MTPAELIATNLAALPHPDGAPRQLPGFASRLLPEPMQQQMSSTARDIGDAIVHLLEINGYSITNQPTQTLHNESPNTANLHCAQCDTRLMQINIANPDHVVTNGRALLEAFANRTSECPHT